MSRDQLDHMLQQCLEGYEAGLTPEECLSAYPQARAQLEPLLRQALSLRIAFAHAPREEFRERTRERLLFAAGRDVSKAYASQPDPEFVSRARARLLSQAGADAQEALRAVPPPQLPFWVNARRRLLEAAAMSSNPRPARPMALALRSGLSAAVVVLAIAVAGLGYFATNVPSVNQPRSASANIEYFEQQLTHAEQQITAGQPVSSSMLEELARMFNDIASQVNQIDSEPEAQIIEKLPSLHDRLGIVIDSVDEESEPEMAQVKQEYEQADEKVRALTARHGQAPAETSTPVTVQTAPTQVPTPTSTPEPTPTLQPIPTPSGPAVNPADLEPGQVVIAFAANDDAYGARWLKVQTRDLSFVIDSKWTYELSIDEETGLAFLDTNSFIFRTEGDDGIPVIVGIIEGQVVAFMADTTVVLRAPGPDADTINPAMLVQLAGDLAPRLHHFLVSFEFTDAD